MKFIILLLLLPFAGKAQVYNRDAAQKFTYKEIGDTIFINGKTILPGDTIFLGNGSAPDHSFLFIQVVKKLSMFNTPRYLSKEHSRQYLVYKERKLEKSIFANAWPSYQPVFISPLAPGKLILVQWYSALETNEVLL